MKKEHAKFLGIMIFVEVLMTVIMIILLIFLSIDISSYTGEALEKGTMFIMENRMKERVEDVIVLIEGKSEETNNKVKYIIEQLYQIISDVENTELHEEIRENIVNMDSLEYARAIQILLEEEETGKITLFTSNSLKDVTEQFEEVDIKKYVTEYPIYKICSFSKAKVYFFAEQSDLNKIVENYIYDIIHKLSYTESENAYVWVNKIVDFSGGNNYAIRLIHPSLKEEEGFYLSTTMEDIEGNHPYATELEGVKENGEVFHTYYFKNKVDDRVTEKASYAKLYEPFDWVIATGEPLDDIFQYTNELKEYSQQALKKALVRIGIILCCFLFITIGVVIIENKKYQQKLDNYITIETEIDPLTKAFNRKTGEEAFKKAFEEFEIISSNMGMMMFDIDNFKRVNDTYGHDVGDVVLQNVSKAIMDNIKKTDKYFRWGGEEFVLLCECINKEEQIQIAEKLLQCVRELSFKCNEGEFNVTVSVGGSWFLKGDTSYQQALKRADTALYYSKHTGKDRYTCAQDL